MEYTKELLEIKKNKSNFLLISAFAGTGKTTTLVEYAKENINSKILYIAFNNATAKKASNIFPSNVESKTFHSIAYKYIGYKYKDKLDYKKTLPFTQETIRKTFGLKRTKDNIELCKTLKTIVENYCYKPYQKISDAVPFKKMIEDRDIICDFAEMLWEKMIDEKSNFPITPDVYLKLFSLSNIKINYDKILFDEVQDANPLILEIVLKQKSLGSSLVMVGDDHQSIYLFRGSNNVLSKIKGADVKYLTKSFRFGKNIAEVANIILKVFKKETKDIKGFEKINDNIGSIDKNKQFAVISRTNSNLFYNSIKAVNNGYKIHFMGGFENYNFLKILDIEKIFLNKRKEIKDYYLKSFKSFDDLKDYALCSNDKEMINYINIVEKYNGKISEIINNIKSNVVSRENANIVLTTVHKSKGEEFKQVLLSNDFPDFITKDGSIDYRKASEEEINILYVASTRAINTLQINKQLEKILKYYKDNEKVITKNSDKNNIFISNIKNRF